MPSLDLVNVLRAHSIAVNDALVEEALRDGEVGPGLAEWAATHLTPDTLLTLDELDLYDALQRSGRADELAAAAAPEGGSKGVVLGGSGGGSVTDGALRTATAALEESTAAIGRQSEVLRQQQEAVARLVAVQQQQGSQNQNQGQSQNQRDAARAAFETRQRAQWASDRADRASAVDSLSRNLGLRIDELAQQNGELAQRVRQTVEGLCRSDDKLLASLQKLGWALPVKVGGGDDQEDEDEDELRQQKAIGRLRDVCLQLIKTTVEGIRTKLDRLYLEALEAAQAERTAVSTSSSSRDADADDVAVLQDELESLYAEILPVAQMAVEQQYLDPALAALGGTNGRNMARSLQALDYMHDCLEFLLEHIGLLTRRIETAAAHHATAEALLAAARTELAVHVPVGASSSAASSAKGSSSASAVASAVAAAAAQRHQKTLSLYGSPVRRRGMTTGGGGGHLRTMTMSGGVGGDSSKNNRRRSSGFGSSSFAQQVSPMDQLLESLSVLLPGEEGAPLDVITSASTSASDNATAANAAFLHATLADRQSKADGVAANAQDAYEAASAAHVADALRATGMARESVLGESRMVGGGQGGGGGVQLVDPEIDGSIAVMAHEVQRVRRHLEQVQRGVEAARRGRSAKREQVTARWG